MRAVLCIFTAAAFIHRGESRNQAIWVKVKLLKSGSFKGFGPPAGYNQNTRNNQDNKNQWPFVKFNRARQSPIDLITRKADNRKLPTLFIVEPDLRGHQAKLHNSGHSVYVYMNDGPEKRPRLSGGPLLSDKFFFEQMHFHWGRGDFRGSEHLINGKSYSLEIHMVFWNSKYGTYKKASTRDDGLAVLTAFAMVTNKNDNVLLTSLTRNLSKITKVGIYYKMDTNDAMQWAFSAVPQNREYFTYPGSLTTEPYSENVVFILLPKPIFMSQSQLQAFRTIRSSEGGYVRENWRELQPFNNRPIIRATNIEWKKLDRHRGKNGVYRDPKIYKGNSCH